MPFLAAIVLVVLVSAVFGPPPRNKPGCQAPVCWAALAALSFEFTHGSQVRELTSFNSAARNNPEAILIGR